MTTIQIETGNSYLLLEPVKAEPRLPRAVLTNPSIDDIDELWPITSTLAAIDFETKGLDATSPDFAVYGMGIANERCNFYVHWDSCTPEVKNLLCHRMASTFLLAHNVYFDAAVAYRLTGRWLPWVGCTYGLFRQLSNEGYLNQEWSLKQAELSLLQWSVSNKDATDEWLISNGYIKGKDKPDKSNLWRVPPHILGPYCALDAEASYLLYTKVFAPYLERFPALHLYHHKYFMNLVKLLIEQRFYGIQLDVAQLEAYNTQLLQDINKLHGEFMEHRLVKPHVAEYNAEIVAEIKAREPRKTTKKGVVTKGWEGWQTKLEKASQINHFNLNSDVQLRWLLYDQLGFAVTLRTENGNPAVSGRVLPAMGEVGKLLVNFNECTKLQGYVQKCAEFHREGKLHLSFRVPGTLTGRLAGTDGLNLQQVPHDEGYMKCWIARPGTCWVNSDFKSLEQVVLAELSQDRTMLKLYGEHANPNHDIYLFNAAHMDGISKKVRSYYDLDNPTEESIMIAKRECKRERGISKVITLASSYGAGVNKLYETLTLSGVSVNKNQVAAMRESYWELYAGVKQYESKLHEEWVSNQGWVYNGIGRPVTVAPDLQKDILNRVCQSTGHDILMIWLEKLALLRSQRYLKFKFIIADFHDQAIVECPTHETEATLKAFEDAFCLLNEDLKGTIKLRGDTSVCSNLWGAKGG